ncbi:hypothetical protein BKA70DRAFT_1104685 [Coprinopsis sp. MPI-PUGE-AT-0042]|nr:hypothetical protein BKA70DRAFT_1104685 [Coprinopsis sp. MPI-PUGE-AT-0042]
MSATTPSTEEIDSYGNSAARSHYAANSLSFIQFGVQLFMVVYGLSLFLETPKSSRKGRGRFILLSIAIILTSAVSTALDARNVFRNLYEGGPTGIEYIAVWRQGYEATNVAAGIAGDTMLVTNIALGDMLLLWRCFILWKDRKWVIIIPALTCVVSIIFGVIAIVPGSRPGLPVGLTPAISTTLSVAMNVMVTTLILHRLLRVRRDMLKLFPEREMPVLYSGIVTILIESAVPLAFFGVCFVMATFVLLYRQMRLQVAARVYSFAEVTSTLYYAFASISPLMIIFRVTTGRSFKSGSDSHAGTAAFSQPIQFAHPMDRRSSTTFDTSTEHPDLVETTGYRRGMEV